MRRVIQLTILTAIVFPILPLYVERISSATDPVKLYAGLAFGATAVFAAYSITHAQVELAISLFAFCLLLGNWLERELTQEISLPPATPPEPAG